MFSHKLRRSVNALGSFDFLKFIEGGADGAGASGHGRFGFSGHGGLGFRHPAVDFTILRDTSGEALVGGHFVPGFIHF